MDRCDWPQPSVGDGHLSWKNAELLLHKPVTIPVVGAHIATWDGGDNKEISNSYEFRSSASLQNLFIWCDESGKDLGPDWTFFL